MSKDEKSKGIGRREFLKRSAAGVAVAGSNPTIALEQIANLGTGAIATSSAVTAAVSAISGNVVGNAPEWTKLLIEYARLIPRFDEPYDLESYVKNVFPRQLKQFVVLKQAEDKYRQAIASGKYDVGQYLSDSQKFEKLTASIEVLEKAKEKAQKNCVAVFGNDFHFSDSDFIGLTKLITHRDELKKQLGLMNLDEDDLDAMQFNSYEKLHRNIVQSPTNSALEMLGREIRSIADGYNRFAVGYLGDPATLARNVDILRRACLEASEKLGASPDQPWIDNDGWGHSLPPQTFSDLIEPIKNRIWKEFGVPLLNSERYLLYSNRSMEEAVAYADSIRVMETEQPHLYRERQRQLEREELEAFKPDSDIEDLRHYPSPGSGNQLY